MLNDSLHCRLEALNRQQLPASFKQSAAPAVVAQPAARRSAAPAKRSRLNSLLDRGQPTTTPHGEHLTIAVPISEWWPAGDDLIRSRHEQLIAQAKNEPSDERRKFVASLPGKFLGLDLETCGLSGSALFLVGAIRELNGQFTVELLFARTYAEEAAVLCSLGERLHGAETLLTFNGKSFDWPMVNDRWHRHLLHRKSPLPTLAHYDVLHHARRRWRKALPDCKLQTIERMICRRHRTGDIAGHLIPGAYDHYVQTKQPAEMEQVLYHNAVDLVTLLDIAMRLAS